MKKTIYGHRIKLGAYNKMTLNLKYPEQAYAIKDGEICRITDVISQSENFLRNEKDSLGNPILYQIEIHNSNNELEAIIFPDLLDELPQEDWIYSN